MKQLLIILIIIYIAPISSFSQDNITIEAYIEQAFNNNPGLQAQYKAYEASLEKAAQLSSLPDPSVSFGVFISPVETRVGPQKAKISISQMFPWFGTLDAKGKQAALLAKANFDLYNSAKSKLSYKIKKEYYSLFFVRKSISYIIKQIEIINMLEKQALIKAETGQTSLVDVLHFQMTKDELKNKEKNLRNEEKERSVKFNLLLNRDKNTDIQVSDSLKFLSETVFSVDSVLINNPKIKSSEKLIEFSDHLIRESKLNAYPKFGVGVDYVFVGKRTDIDLENNGKDIIMPMVTMSIPIYGKKYKAKRKESELKKEEFILKKESLKNDLISEFKTSMSNYYSAVNDFKLYNQLIITAGQALSILKTAYETSGKDYDQVLFLQKKVLEYRLNEIKALVTIKISESYLEYLSNN